MIIIFVPAHSTQRATPTPTDCLRFHLSELANWLRLVGAGRVLRGSSTVGFVSLIVMLDAGLGRRTEDGEQGFRSDVRAAEALRLIQPHCGMRQARATRAVKVAARRVVGSRLHQLLDVEGNVEAGNLARTSTPNASLRPTHSDLCSLV